MTSKIRKLWGQWAIVTAVGLILFGCYYQNINWSEITFIDAVDCSSTDCHLFTSRKAFTNVTLGLITEHIPGGNPNWITKDTFFKDNTLLADPYLLVAGLMGVNDSLVCSLVTFSNDTLVIHTGKIFTDSSSRLAIRVDTLDHPRFRLDFKLRCPE